MAHAHAHHPHAHEVHEDKNYGDPTPASTAYIALIGVLIFVLTVIYLQALYYSSEEKEFAEKITDFDQEQTAVFELKQQAAAALEVTSYHHDYADGLGRATIPVHGEEGAIEKLLAQWPGMPAEHNPPQPVEEPSADDAADGGGE